MGRETLNNAYSNTHTPYRRAPSSKTGAPRLKLHVEYVLSTKVNQSHLVNTAAQIHYYAASPAINVTTAATKSAIHKLSQHPAVTSPTHP